MERSAAEEDVLTCPNCSSDDGLVIGWFPISKSGTEEYTRVGCEKCETYFSDPIYWHAITFWNNFSILEFLKKGKKHKYFELYKYLYLKAKHEKEANELQEKIDIFLKEKITTKCKLSVGDVFKDKRDNTNWIVSRVYSIYACNTGAFWIFKAKHINKHGKIENGEKKFMAKDLKYLGKGADYYTPTRWSQIIINKYILYKGILCNVHSIDSRKRTAVIRVNTVLKKISSLKEITVSVIDLNST